MKKLRFWLLGFMGTVLVVGLVFVLNYLIRRYFNVQLQFLALLLQIFYEAIPQGILWVLFLLLALLAAMSSLRRRKPLRRVSSHLTLPFAERRVAALANWIKYYRRPYYRTRLNFEITRLGVGVLAQKMRISEQQVREGLRENTLGLPANIQEYLSAGLKRWPENTPAFAGWLDRLFKNNQPGDDPKNRDTMQKVLQYLEKELEIIYDDHND